MTKKNKNGLGMLGLTFLQQPVPREIVYRVPITNMAQSTPKIQLPTMVRRVSQLDVL